MTVKVVLAELGERVRWDATGGDPNLLVSTNGKVLTRTTGASTTQFCRKITRARTTGKLFAAAQITAGSGSATCFGLANELHPLTGAQSTLGSSNNSWGILMNGNRLHQNFANATDLGAFSVGHCMLLALDVESGNLWFGKSTTLGGAFGITWANGGNPVTGANPTYTNVARAHKDDGFNSLAALFIAGSLRANNSGLSLATEYRTWQAVMEALPGFQIWGELYDLATMDWCTQPTDNPPNRWYDGRITEDGEPIYSRGASVFVWGRDGFRAPFSSFELENADGGLDWLPKANVTGMPCTLLFGDNELPLVGMDLAGTMTLARIEHGGEHTLRVIATDKLSNMKRTVCPEAYDATIPNAALAGSRKPFMAGPVDYVPLVPIEPAILEYQLADDELTSELGAGSALQLRDQGVLITGGTVGWTFGSRADNYGVRRITNPAGKQVASTRGRVAPRDSTFLDTTFPSWTGDNPNGWAITSGTETGTRRFTKVAGPALGCQSDGTGTLRMSTTTTMVPDDPYNYEIVVSAHSGGRVLVSDDTIQYIAVLDRVGTFRGVFSPQPGAGNLVLSMISGTSTNLTITSVKVWKSEIGPTFSHWMTNLAIRRGGLRLEDLNLTDLAALSVGAPPLGYYTRDQELVVDVMQRSLDSQLAFMWQDRTGQIRFRRLRKPTPGGKATWHFDDLVLHGDVVPRDDMAPNLPPSFNGRRNYSPHREADIAGSIYSGQPALAAQLQQEWLANSPLVGLHPFYAEPARTRDPYGLIVATQSGLTMVTTATAANWADKARFYDFEVEIEDDQAHEVEPGDTCMLTTDRHGLDLIYPGESEPGKHLVIVNADSRYTSSLVRITAWG